VPGLSIRLLGPFQVTLDGEAVVSFRSDKVRALLAYLCVEAEGPHRREKLAGLLWPDWPERSARTNLRQALANLRQVIGDHAATPPFLRISRQTIQFDRTSDAWVDVIAFAYLTALQPARQHTANETIDALEEAVELYRGDFLDGFSLPDSPPFEEWTLLQREQSRRLVIEALHRLIDAYTEGGNLERALQRTWRLLELAPWREQAHRQAMRLLALTGQRSAALAQYETCRRLLAEELDVEPAAKTMLLYEGIRSGALEAPAPLPPRGRVPTHGLPAAIVPFVGRERELTQLRELLADSSCRLLSLVGPGGSGKTRLAVEAVAALEDHFAHGVHFVPLAPVEGVDAIVPTIAQALGFSFAPAEGSLQAEPRQQLLRYLRRKNMLLLTDNFEHLLEGTGVITDILRMAPNVKVLTTSRARLNVRGETLFPVRGLHYPPVAADAVTERAELQDVGRYDAITLFLQGARQARPDFEAIADDLRDIARVCQLVQGMPLGILLAAAWIEVLAPGEIAGEIEKSLDFLETGWRAVPERQRSLRAVFDHSWTLLTDREREAFQALSVFRGGFTREAAEEVGASLRDLKTLVGKSFLQQPTPAGRYEVHELLRQYAAEKLAASPAAHTAARDRHAAHYTAALERFALDLQGPQQRAAMAAIEADSDNIRAAWNWAVEQEQIDRLDRVMEGLARFYWRRGRYQEGEAAFRVAVDGLTDGVSPPSLAPDGGSPSGYRLRVLARAVAWHAHFSRALGRWALRRRERVAWLQEQSLALLQRPELAGQDTRAERALITYHMGHTIFMSDHEGAKRLFEESLALYRALDDPWGAATVLHWLANTAEFRGAYGDARAALEESLEIFQALGDQEGTAGVMSDLAWLAVDQGSFEEAERLAREGAARSQALGDPEGIGFGLLTLGMVLENMGKFAEARSVLEECWLAFEELGYRSFVTSVEAVQSSIKLHLGRYGEAREHAERALSLARERDLPFRIGYALVVLGTLALVEEAYTDAEELSREGLTVCRGIKIPADVGWAHAALAYVARELRRPVEMRHHLLQALEVVSETGVVPTLLWTLPAAALLLADQGAGERAVELYALASRHGLVAQSRWFEDVAGRDIDAIAASLPPDVVAAAEERGRARDLEATAEGLLVELEQMEGVSRQT
jgi:DNA-binding SARP family transcriptional activator/predicted ATPase